MTCAECGNHLAAYHRGALPEATARALERHAAECAACAAALERRPALPGLARERTPPPAARDATLRAVARARRHGRRLRWAGALAVGVAAIVVLTLATPRAKRASDVPYGAAALYAAEQARPQLAELDTAEREVRDALSRSPNDRELERFLRTILTRRRALEQRIREATS